MESDFVHEAINDLLVRGLIKKCNETPIVVNPLTVSIQSSGKKRLILDLRHVNKYLWKQSVKYEDIRTVLNYVEQNDFMFKFDIHSAYHFISIFPLHTIFLGFSWGYTCFYKFLVLPFGLSTAPYLFTKLTRQLISKWRGEGKMVSMFLDDGWSCEKDFTSCSNVASSIKNDLLLSGFVPKAEKSLWLPVQTIEFLGNILESTVNRISIPNRRVHKTFKTISDIEISLKEHRRVHVRLVASFVGQIISMSIVLGHIAQIMTRYLSMDIAGARSWSSYIELSPDGKLQLKFWKDNLMLLNTSKINVADVFTKIVFSDVSGTGYAGYELKTIHGIAHGLWTNEEKIR